jgi:hypothetical protein
MLGLILNFEKKLDLLFEFVFSKNKIVQISLYFNFFQSYFWNSLISKQNVNHLIVLSIKKINSMISSEFS